jgi:hypothetical protein
MIVPLATRSPSRACPCGSAGYQLATGTTNCPLTRRLGFGLEPNREPGSVIVRGLVGGTIRYGVAWWYPMPGHRPGGHKIDARRAVSTHRRSRQLACFSSEPAMTSNIRTSSARPLPQHNRWSSRRFSRPVCPRRYSPDLPRDSRVADVVVRPASPTNPQEHRTGEQEQRSH